MSSVFKGFKSLLASPAAASPSSRRTAVKFHSASASASAAAAKLTASKVASKTPKKATTTKPKVRKSPPSRNSGILKVTPVSPALGQFLGTEQASRTDAVKQIWTYIKSNNLQNPTNKREIICDDKLKAIFDGKDKVGFLEIGRLLTRHFVKTT